MIVLAPAVVAFLAGEHARFGLIGGTRLLEVGIHLVTIALGAQVASAGQHAPCLVGVLDDLVFSVDRLVFDFALDRSTFFPSAPFTTNFAGPV